MTTHQNVEDVVVRQAESFQVDRAEDVFIEDHAAGKEVDIDNPEDVKFAEGMTHKSVYRDCIVDRGGDVSVKQAEDVAIRSGAVQEGIGITNVEDVFVGQFSDSTVEGSDNAFLQDGAVGENNSLYLLDPGTVYLDSGSVNGDVFIHDVDEIEDEEGAVGGTIGYEEEDNVFFPVDERGTLSIDNPETVVIEEGAITGDLTTDAEVASHGDIEAIKRRYQNDEITELEMENQLDEAMGAESE